MKRIIKLIKRQKKLKKSKNKIHVYDLCVVKKSTKNKRVYEKLGTFSFKNSWINLNIFRLSFWLSKNISMTGNVVFLLVKYRIFNLIIIK